MPYGLDSQGRPIFLISTMAMHTQNLQADPRASLFVTAPNDERRCAGCVQGDIGRNSQPNSGSRAGSGAYRLSERYPNSKYWVDFEDFFFYRMDVLDVYYVGGFGVMGWVAASEYLQAQSDPLMNTSTISCST